MKRSAAAFLLLLVLGLGAAFVASATLTSYAVANSGKQDNSG